MNVSGGIRFRANIGWSKQPWHSIHGFLKSFCASTIFLNTSKQQLDSSLDFMGCMPWLRVWKFGLLTIITLNVKALCTQFLEPNSNGIVKMCVAKESCEWCSQNHTRYLWSNSILPLQYLQGTSHHKNLEETTLDPLACSIKKDCEKTFSAPAR